MQETIPRARRGRLSPNKGPLRSRLLIPYVLLLVIALAWSAYWLIAQNRISAELQDWRSGEATEGRTLTCDRESLGGYPFRFEFRCSGFAWSDSRGGIGLMAGEVRAVALAYKPWHIIFEADAPGALKGPDGLTLDATWTALRASAELTTGLPSAIAVTAERPAIGGSARVLAIPALSAEAVSLHMRPARTEPAGDYQYAMRASGLSEAGTSENWAISIDGNVRRAVALIPAGDPRVWQAAGGGIFLDKVTVTDGGATISGSGEIAPTAAGQWSGKFAVTVSGVTSPDPVSQPTYGQALMAAVSAAAEFFGRDESIDGKPARAVDLVVENGNIRLGSLPLGVLPPLF